MQNGGTSEAEPGSAPIAGPGQLQRPDDRPGRLPGPARRRAGLAPPGSGSRGSASLRLQQPANRTGGTVNGSEGRHQRLRRIEQEHPPRHAPRQVRHGVHRRERHHGHSDPGPACWRPDSILGRFPGEVGGQRREHHRRRRRAEGPLREGPRRAAVGRPGRRRRDRVDRPLHQARGRLQAPRGRRQEGDHLGPRDRARHHGGPRASTSTTTTPTQHHIISNASCTTNCLAPVGEGAARRGRHRPRADDHDSRLHRGPAPAGHAPQGSAPRPRCCDQPDPGVDRRRQGGRPGAAGAERQAQRDGGARPGGHRLGRRPDVPGLARRPASRRSTARSRLRPRAR